MIRNEQLKKLSRLIKRGHLPGDPDVDWAEVYSSYLKSKKERKPSAKLRTTEQIYRSRAYTINYRAKRKQIEGLITSQDLIKIMEIFNNKCKECGATSHLVFDHIVPYYRGGKNTADNLQILCRLCNMEKGIGGSL